MYKINKNLFINEGLVPFIRFTNEGCSVLLARENQDTAAYRIMKDVSVLHSLKTYTQVQDTLKLIQEAGKTSVGVTIRKKETTQHQNLQGLENELYTAICNNPSYFIDKVQFVTNDKTEPHYNYLASSVDEYPEGSYPNWNFFMSMMSDEDKSIFMQYLGACLNLKNSSKQYLWIYDGKGSKGKSQVCNILAELFGSELSFIYTPHAMDNNFSTQKLINKRLILFPEMMDRHFFKKPLGKMITGQDTIDSEMKGENGATRHKGNFKSIIFSNHIPEFDPNRSYTSNRPLILNMSGEGDPKVCPGLVEFDESTQNFLRNTDGSWKFLRHSSENLFRSELPFFLRDCLIEYNKHNTNDGNIVFDANKMEDMILLAQSDESKIAKLFEEYIDVDFSKTKKYLIINKHLDIIIDKIIQYHKVIIDKKKLKIIFPCYDTTHTTVNGKPEYVVRNMRLKDNWEITKFGVLKQKQTQNGSIIQTNSTNHI